MKTCMLNRFDRTRKQRYTRRIALEGLESRTLLSANLVVLGAANLSMTISNGSTSTSSSLGTVFGGANGNCHTFFLLNELSSTSDTSTINFSQYQPVTITGDTSSAFAVGKQPSVATIPALYSGNPTSSQYTTFMIVLATTTIGSYNATVHIASNDPAKPDFSFAITGTVTSTQTTVTTTTAGSGRSAQLGDIVTVNYTGSLASDGTIFDSSLNSGRTPFLVQIGASSVIDGWTKGLVGMKVGETRTLNIPSVEGYGSSGYGSTIPANADLVFTVSCLRIVSKNFVPKLYQDILGRVPDIAGIASWTNKLMADYTYTPASVASGFINSQEYRQNRIESLYQSVLGRASDTSGMTGWLSYLSTTGNTVESMQSLFYGSSEFAAAHGGTTTGVLTGLYEVLLHREPDNVGLAAWTDVVNSGSTIAQVAYRIIRAPEGLNTSVTRIYELYLHREPDAGGLAGWAALLGQNGKSETDIVSGIMSAEEYYNS